MLLNVGSDPAHHHSRFAVHPCCPVDDDPHFVQLLGRQKSVTEQVVLCPRRHPEIHHCHCHPFLENHPSAGEVHNRFDAVLYYEWPKAISSFAVMNHSNHGLRIVLVDVGVAVDAVDADVAAVAAVDVAAGGVVDDVAAVVAAAVGVVVARVLVLELLRVVLEHGLELGLELLTSGSSDVEALYCFDDGDLLVADGE